MTIRTDGRPYDRTVRLRAGETLLLVDGDDELFLEQTPHGVIVSDARGMRMRTETETINGYSGAGVDRLIVKRRSRT